MCSQRFDENYFLKQTNMNLNKVNPFWTNMQTPFTYAADLQSYDVVAS